MSNNERLLPFEEGKFLGQEFELDEDLTTLQTSAFALASEVDRLPSTETEADAATHDEELDAKIRPSSCLDR